MDRESWKEMAPPRRRETAISMKGRLLRLMPHAGKYPTAVKGLSMVRREQAHQIESRFYKPSVSSSGAKRSRIVTREYLYGEKPVHDCRGWMCRAFSR